MNINFIFYLIEPFFQIRYDLEFYVADFSISHSVNSAESQRTLFKFIDLSLSLHLAAHTPYYIEWI